MTSVILKGCVLLLATVVLIDGKSVKSKRQYDDEEMPDLECLMKVFTCAAPVMSLNEDVIREGIEQAGIAGVCGLFQPIADCLEPELVACGDQFPPEARQPLNMATKLINFICRDELESIVADQDCMFGSELEAASKKCNDSPSGEVCNLTEETSCALDVYEETCENPALANKFRNLIAELSEEAGCEKAKKVRSLNWLKALKILRRR